MLWVLADLGPGLLYGGLIVESGIQREAGELGRNTKDTPPSSFAFFLLSSGQAGWKEVSLFGIEFRALPLLGKNSTTEIHYFLFLRLHLSELLRQALNSLYRPYWL